MELKITTNIGETFNIGSTVIKITYLKCRMFYSVNVVVVRESRQIRQLFLKYLIDIPHRGFIGLKMYFFFHDSIAIVSRKKKKILIIIVGQCNIILRNKNVIIVNNRRSKIVIVMIIQFFFCNYNEQFHDEYYS